MTGNDRIRRDLEAIFRAALEAVDPERLVHLALEGALGAPSCIPALIAQARSALVLAAGKAAPAMARALRTALGEKLGAALVVALPGAAPHALADERIRVVESAHPVPTDASVKAAQAALEILGRAGKDDVVIVALSGGASAMLATAPADVPLADKAAITERALRSGASIREVNNVRKHLSTIKGGQLLRALGEASVLGLVLSDVPGNDLATIGSGPTAADPSTFSDAIAVLKRRGLWGRAPEAVRDHLERGDAGEIPETVKPGDPVLARVTNLIIGDNAAALSGAERAARALGYSTDRWRDLCGEANDLGRSLAAHLCALQGERQCVLSGGEPTVTVGGTGRGGRAGQTALATAIELARIGRDKRIAALFAGTDGIDGSTDAAGAFVFPGTVADGTAAGANAASALSGNDSYNFFKAARSLFITGPTGTNVSDIFIGLVNY